MHKLVLDDLTVESFETGGMGAFPSEASHSCSCDCERRSAAGGGGCNTPVSGRCGPRGTVRGHDQTAYTYCECKWSDHYTCRCDTENGRTCRASCDSCRAGCR